MHVVGYLHVVCYVVQTLHETSIAPVTADVL